MQTERRVYTRPVDNTLQAFKHWINETVAALGGEPDEEPITEQEWRENWESFWGTVKREQQ